MGKKTKGKAVNKPKMQAATVIDSLAAMASSEGEDKILVDSSPTLENDVTLIPFPDTPEKPLTKKSKRGPETDTDLNKSTDILAAIRKLSLKHDATFQKVSLIEKTTQATSREIESLSMTVKQLVSDVGENKRELCRLHSEVKELRQSNTVLKAALDESRRYGWKSFLKLHGLKEEDCENVRSRIIGILQKVVPDAPVNFEAGVDIVHRLGPKTGKTRSIIIMFSLRRVRDAVWQAVRRCKFLKDNNLTITEPVPPEDRAAREKLWPLVKKAREEGKRASFKDSYALIDGKKFNYADA